MKNKPESILEKFANPGKLQLISTAALHSGLAYQRPVRPAHVRQLIRKWDHNYLTPIEVSFRDGKYNVINGQHRIEAMKKMNHGEDLVVQCLVYTGLTYQQEAAMYYLLDKTSGHLKLANAIKALMESGTDPELMDIKQRIERAGFTWALDRPSGATYEIKPVREIINAYQKLGGQAFSRMLGLMAGTWHGAQNSLKSGILNILHDERYTGTYIIGKRESREVGSNLVRLKDESQWVKIPEHHPAIISKELFDKTQSTIRRAKCPKKHVHFYPLREKVYCGNCLHRLSRVGNVTFRFFCRHSQADMNAPCHGLRVDETELESLVYEVLKKQAQILLGMGDVDVSGMKGLSSKHIGNSQQISEMQAQKRTLFEQMILGELSEQEYRDNKAALDAELVRLQETQAALSTKLAQQQTDEKTKKANKALAQKVVDMGNLSSELVDALIERVYVYPGQNVEIVWKVAGFGAGEGNL